MDSKSSLIKLTSMESIRFHLRKLQREWICETKKSSQLIPWLQEILMMPSQSEKFMKKILINLESMWTSFSKIKSTKSVFTSQMQVSSSKKARPLTKKLKRGQLLFIWFIKFYRCFPEFFVKQCAVLTRDWKDLLSLCGFILTSKAIFYQESDTIELWLSLKLDLPTNKLNRLFKAKLKIKLIFHKALDVWTHRTIGKFSMTSSKWIQSLWI